MCVCARRCTAETWSVTWPPPQRPHPQQANFFQDCYHNDSCFLLTHEVITFYTHTHTHKPIEEWSWLLFLFFSLCPNSFVFTVFTVHMIHNSGSQTGYAFPWLYLKYKTICQNASSWSGRTLVSKYFTQVKVLLKKDFREPLIYSTGEFNATLNCSTYPVAMLTRVLWCCWANCKPGTNLSCTEAELMFCSVENFQVINKIRWQKFPWFKSEWWKHST